MRSLGSALIALCFLTDVFAKKVILMEPFDPMKVRLSADYIVRSPLTIVTNPGDRGRLPLNLNCNDFQMQGTWYVLRRNLRLLDAVSCIKFDLKHDPVIEDLYAMTTHWITTE